MRNLPMTAVLGLAIVVGGALADSAMSANGPGSGNPASGPNQMGANPPGGGGGNSRDPEFGRDVSGGGNSAAMSRIRECPNGGAVGIDCPEERNTWNFSPKPKEDECQCKPVAMTVGGKTQIVLDCYQTKLYQNVRRTYVCARAEN